MSGIRGSRPPGHESRRPSRGLLVAAPALLLLCASALAGGTPDAGDREWNQRGGDEGHRGSVDVEPLRGEPVEAWRATLRGPLEAGPVTWGGVLFTASGEGRKRELAAFSIADGSPQGTQPLGPGTNTHLATWQGTVVVVDSGGVRAFRHSGGGFKVAWVRRAAEVTASPTVFDGVAFVRTEKGLEALDVINGRAAERFRTGTLHGPLTLVPRDDGGVDAVELAITHRPRFEPPETLVLKRVDLGSGATTETVHGIAPPALRAAPWPLLHASDAASPAHVYCVSRPGFEGADGSVFGLLRLPVDRGAPLLAPVDITPVVAGDHLYGFSAAGALHEVQGTGAYIRLAEAGALPRGARIAAGSRAGDVVYMGNWAFDRRTRRVIWCLPDLDPVTPCIPVGDGRVAMVLRDGVLLCLRDGSAGGTAAFLPAALRGGPDAPPSPPPAPSAGTGILLADGTVLAGTPAAEGDAWTLTVQGAPPRTFPAAEVAAVLTAEGCRRVGSAAAMWDAWRRALALTQALEYDALARVAAAEGHVTLCREILDRARRAGMAPERAAALERPLTGRRESVRDAARRDARAAEAAAVEARARAATDAAVIWCAREGYPEVAAALLHGTWDPADAAASAAVEERARALVPPAFPWKDAPDGGRRWLRWAREILPAGGEFLPPDSPVLRGFLRPPWDRDTIVLRTPHTLFVSRVADPGHVGACLRRAERTATVLTGLLGAGNVRPVRDDYDRMEVRLHRTEADYRAEQSAVGYPIPWSVGHYDPNINASRFFLPGSDDRDLLGRRMLDTLSHELTHHFLASRWKAARPGAGRAGKQPGTWIVEGMARFVEDQISEEDRREVRLDDPTVRSVDCAARLHGDRMLPDVVGFTDQHGDAFYGASAEPVFVVRLRHTLAATRLSSLNASYEVSGALVFFLLQRAGPERREGFLAYLADVYTGRPPAAAWKALRFASPEAFRAEFAAFLESQ